MIECKNISYKYELLDEEELDGEELEFKKAVDNISLKINAGEFIGILGKNGSGKSTLARLFNGLLIPLDGVVEVLGLDTKNEETLLEIRKNLGIVFQNPDNQIVASIVEEDIAFGLENLGVPSKEINNRIDEALKKVSMNDHRLSSPEELSGGQKQRIAIAGILAMKPKVIIFDESTAMLDPKGKEDVINIIYKLNKKENVTVILITHHMEEVIDADRLYIINNGHLVKEGLPINIFNDREFLESVGLEPPKVIEIGNALRNKGLIIKKDIKTVDDLVEEILNNKKKN